MKGLVCFCALVTAAFAVGNWQEVEVTESNVQPLAEFAASYVSNMLNSPVHYKLAKVISARRQVVAGYNYDLVIEVGPTNCKKNEVENSNISDCEFSHEPAEQCDVRVYYRPWTNTRKVNKANCQRVDTLQKRFGGDGHDKFHVHQQMFEEFVQKFGKRYKTEKERMERLRIFQENLLKIKELNDNEQGTAKYGVTQFTDLTAEEFKHYYLGLRPDLARPENDPEKAKIPTNPIPDSFDWREKGVVTEIKNQGQCGSCWAFSTTGNIEGQWAIKKGKLVSLSEQELVDCDTVDEGCNGGLPSNAYKEIIKIGGLEGETDYPYKGIDEKCFLNKTDIRVYINNSLAISENETEMAAWLVMNGPISIGINANAMQFYFGGVSHPFKFLCNPNNLDHGVLIVGYGVDTFALFKKKLPFWLIKNSWGSSWGEKGYYRVYRGDGTCGVNKMATSAVID